ncbi:unnamed protein product [Phytomonas sp. EM1]|nr:unnamed protein product [Phytomonas sp. EM1]|eukprot:CCW61450.1 unnamed protein product [Phytomonas sp. isolate EM1]
MDRISHYFVSRGAGHLLDRISHFQESSATSELAAERLNCECSQIAKSIAIFIKNPALRRGKLRHAQNLPAAAQGPPGSPPTPVAPMFYDKLCSIIVVTSGDAKVSKLKFKDRFNSQLDLIGSSIVQDVIGYPVGGVCPFGINSNVRVYLDVSLKRFDTIHAACGTPNTTITLNLDELEEYSENFVEWVDVCDGWM